MTAYVLLSSRSTELTPTYMLGPNLKVLQVMIDCLQRIDFSQASREWARALHHLE